MADKPVYTEASGILSADATNANFEALAEAVKGCLGRGGTGEASNSIEGNIDFDTHRIINLGDPINDQDGATKAWVEANYGDSNTTDAADYAAAALAAQVAAEAAEDAALISETNAATSEGTAELWATEAEDVVVADGKYSAYHWAQKAAGWGGQAASETTAGVIEIATQAEVDAGTDDLRSVTPLKLETRLGDYTTERDTITDLLASAFGGYLNGMLVTPTGTGTVSDYLGVSIATGNCRDAANSEFISLSSSLVKNINSSWVVGTGNGGFPSGLSLTGDTWYHVFVIKNPTTGVVDGGFDTSLTATNLLASAGGYTKYRRVGSILTTASGDVLSFTSCLVEGASVQCLWAAPIMDYSSSVGKTTPTALLLRTPLGIKTRALMNAGIYASSSTGVTANIYEIGSGMAKSDPWAAPLGNISTWDNRHTLNPVECITDTLSQVNAIGYATTTSIKVSVQGWVDFRH